MRLPPGRFVDVTGKLGIHFRHEASPTSRKYLLETMGSGVALFDDNDGRLDIFFANGARLDDPTPKGTIPRKDNPKYRSRIFHQKTDGTFEDVTEKADLTGFGYSTGVAVGHCDNDGYEDLFVAGYGRSTLYHNHGDGTFTDVTDSAGVPVRAGQPAPLGWIKTMTDASISSLPVTCSGTLTTFIAASLNQVVVPIATRIFSSPFLFSCIPSMAMASSPRYRTGRVSTSLLRDWA
jgi:hypothetical protein